MAERLTNCLTLDDNLEYKQLTPRTHGGTAVDFIERWFGVSPDGGDGTLELLYLGVGALIAFALLRWIVHRGRYRRSG